jgi:hypothetical protein
MPATVHRLRSAIGRFGVPFGLLAEPPRPGVRRVPLPVAFVALATLDLRLGFFDGRRERLADVVGFLELPSSATPHESLVSSAVDQVTSRRIFLPDTFTFAFFHPCCFVIPPAPTKRSKGPCLKKTLTRSPP